MNRRCFGALPAWIWAERALQGIRISTDTIVDEKEERDPEMHQTRKVTKTLQQQRLVGLYTRGQ
ncbi:MAG: hypothetical protein ACRD3F_00145 [Acidobacteriaceae bacterium]